MFNKDVKVLHLEPTTVCNAKCPQCAREDADLYNDNLNRNELTLEKCKELFKLDFIKNLDKMFMCGTFGDPASTKDALDIFKYFRKHNPSIILGLNTNGSIRNNKWWVDLAKIFNQSQDFVVFSIDGLADTNHIYRRNVNWNKAMSNAQAFINAGGSAHWDMLIFKHNETQVKEAEDLAKQMGFTWFRTKVSKRFITMPVNGIAPPETLELPNINNVSAIKCHALEEKSIYVSANGLELPCCWMGDLAYNMDKDLKEMLKSKNWIDIVKSWKSTPHKICYNSCGVDDSRKTSFEMQWNRNIELKNT